MSGPLLNVGKLSEPLTKLVETIAAGIGGLYAPVGTVRQAKADAKAAIILAEAEGKVASMEMRVKHRLKHLEETRQENIEKIVNHAALEMPETVSSESVSRDWTLQFISLAQDVCDEDMQRIWARILAGEVANPGSFAKRTIEFVKTLEKEEAEYFTVMSQFAFLQGNKWPVLIANEFTYTFVCEACGNHDVISHFSTIGLLRSTPRSSYRSNVLGTRLKYHDKTILFTGKEMPKIIGNLEYSVAFLDYTSIGLQLFRIAGAKQVPDYIEKLNQSLQNDVLNLGIEIVGDA